MVEFEEEEATEGTGAPVRSIIQGRVDGGANMRLQLVQNGDALAQGMLGPTGTFRLRNLAAGTYTIQILDAESSRPLLQSEELSLNGTDTLEVALAMPAASLPTPEPAAAAAPYASEGIEPASEAEREGELAAEKPLIRSQFKRRTCQLRGRGKQFWTDISSLDPPQRFDTRVHLLLLTDYLLKASVSFGFRPDHAAHCPGSDGHWRHRFCAR